MIRLGGPIFLDQDRGPGASETHGSAATDVVKLAHMHTKLGYRAAYAPQVDIRDRDRIRAIRNAFAEADVMLAEVQCWVNLLDPDPQKAKANRRLVIESLAVAEELGARYAITTVGSYSPDSLNHHSARNFSEDAFEAAVEMARYFIDQVKPTHAHFVYEVLAMHVVDSPSVLKRLVDAVDRTQFGIHMDLANLVNCPRRYWDSGGLISEAVNLFGDRIVGAHAKDIELEEIADTVRLREVRPGLGNLDYVAYLTALDRLPQAIPLMMEHLPSEDEYSAAAGFIRSVAKRTHVSL